MQIANLIAGLCCQSIEVDRCDDKGKTVKIKKNVLPQGAPTSPVLSNVICQSLDYYLNAASRRFGVRYSRYADDITFSSMHNIFQQDSDFIAEIKRIIAEQNFMVNPNKTRLQKDAYRQVVTGLVVNKEPNIPKRKILHLRQLLYFWEQYGYDKANSIYKAKLQKCARSNDRRTPELIYVLRGQIGFLKMIKGSENSVYVSLNNRFQKLLSSHSNADIMKLELDNNMSVVHSPVKTVEFLKYFKYDNNLSFKQLVHLPLEQDNFDYSAIIKQARSQFNDLIGLNSGNLRLPRKLVEEVDAFLKLLNENGQKYFKKTGKHLLENPEIGRLIQKFKGNYRFGNEKAESSILSELIINMANKAEYKDLQNNIIYSFGETDTSGYFDLRKIIFSPSTQIFQSKANFFTWVPNVRTALYLIFEMILKHSNNRGIRKDMPDGKDLIFELRRTLAGDIIKIDLVITDTFSIVLGDVNSMMRDMRRDLFKTLAGVCDFKVQFQAGDGLNYECQILPFSKKMELLPVEASEGFKYILTFYD